MKQKVKIIKGKSSTLTNKKNRADYTEKKLAKLEEEKTIKEKRTSSIKNKIPPSKYKKHIMNHEDSEENVDSDENEEVEDSFHFPGEDTDEDAIANDDDNNESNDDDDDDNNESNDDDDDDKSDDGENEEKSKEFVPKKMSPIMPDNQIIYVTNLPNNYKEIDVAEVFGKYGEIHSIKLLQNGKAVLVIFTSADSATAALGANNKGKVNGSVIKVSLKQSKPLETENEKRTYRTVFVKNVNIGDMDLVKEHFSSCGEIEKIKFLKNNNALIIFATTEQKEAAMKLHNTILSGLTIGVYNNNNIRQLDPQRTIRLDNKQNLNAVSGDRLVNIFSKFGDIDHIEVLCKRKILAFIEFKDEESVTEAFKLNGTIVDDLELEIGKYEPFILKRNLSIFIQNVKPGVTEGQVRKLFSSCGEIESIFVTNGFGIVKFKNEKSFCKSFLLNESKLQGQPIFIEPYSPQKQRIRKQDKLANMNYGKRTGKPFKTNPAKKAKKT